MNRWTPGASRRAKTMVCTLMAGLALAGCASFQPGRVAVGQDQAVVRAALGAPTGIYPLDGGRQRLEYARGPMGRETWMVDLDAAGRVTAVVQALNADNFAQIKPGMTTDSVLRLLGRPGSRQGEFRGRETWSWRIESPFCLRLQVTFDADRRVMDGAAQGPDPMCTPDV